MAILKTACSKATKQCKAGSTTRLHFVYSVVVVVVVKGLGARSSGARVPALGNNGRPVVYVEEVRLKTTMIFSFLYHYHWNLELDDNDSPEIEVGSEGHRPNIALRHNTVFLCSYGYTKMKKYQPTIFVKFSHS